MPAEPWGRWTRASRRTSASAYDAIAELPNEQRRALFLAAYLGRTAREIGELEGIPLGTAKTRIRTAMLRLRDSLERRNEV